MVRQVLQIPILPSRAKLHASRKWLSQVSDPSLSSWTSTVPFVCDPSGISGSQYDTILINDVTHSAIAQPHNLLQVREFRFTAEELETYSKLPLKDRASGSAVYDAPEASKEDTVLLQVVGTLEALRRQSNVSAVLREGKFAAPDEPRSDEDWKRQGRRVLESNGIAIPKSFDPEWPIRVQGAGVSRGD